MTTVVLMGYRCAGKSRILDCARSRGWEDVGVLLLDSDKRIAEGYLDGNGEPAIYEMFVRHGRDAIEMIEANARAFLDRQHPSKTPRLIAAGPALVCRQPEFDSFCERVKPSFLYLVQTAEEAAKCMLDLRRAHLDQGLNLRPNFGSWDEDVLTRRQPADSGQWIDVPSNQVVDKVAVHLETLDQLCRKVAARDNWFSATEVKSDSAVRDAIVDRVAALLSLSTPP